MLNPVIPASDKFLHVAYEHRYFALAGRAWNQFGPLGISEAQQEANALLPGIGVLVQDSLLLHARLLIDFYTKEVSKEKEDITDILLTDFDLPAVSANLSKQLKQYKKPIEVHLLHLTTWRDVAYREQNIKTPKGELRQRIDWNRHNTKIIDLLLDALHVVSKSNCHQWGEPFRHLHRCVGSVLTDPSVSWPKELSEKHDMIAYLKSLGLS